MHLPQYNQSLPPSNRTGGDLVEMEIIPSNVTAKSPSFFFVADNYTVHQIKDAINLNSTLCTTTNFTINDPITLNSTGNLRQETVVQYYRGDSAMILLQGYNNAQGNASLPFPPFAQNATADAWGCLNPTIGRSIPLLEMNHPNNKGKTAGIVLGVLFAVFFFYRYISKHRKKEKGKDREYSVNYPLMGQSRFSPKGAR